MMFKFEVNNDLDLILFNWHNKFHFYVSMLIAGAAPLYSTGSVWFIGLSGFLVAYIAFLTWELGDGFKPWYYDYKDKASLPAWLNWIRKEFLYSDKFSLQDVLVWDLAGAAIGGVLATIIAVGFN